MPFFYGRWDDAARAHALVGVSERARAVQAGFYAPGAFDPPAIRAGLARITAPVMMYVGQAEIGPTPELAAEAVGLFPAGNSRYSLTQVTTRGWMIPPGSPPGCWPSWADPPGR
jgi:pimeloyl-ACP methyl ester carboxylesterase